MPSTTSATGSGRWPAYLRDPEVENVDINGYDRVWVTYSTGERVAAAPIAASDEALVSHDPHLGHQGRADRP